MNKVYQSQSIFCPFCFFYQRTVITSLLEKGDGWVLSRCALVLKCANYSVPVTRVKEAHCQQQCCFQTVTKGGFVQFCYHYVRAVLAVLCYKEYLQTVSILQEGFRHIKLDWHYRTFICLEAIQLILHKLNDKPLILAYWALRRPHKILQRPEEPHRPHL